MGKLLLTFVFTVLFSASAHPEAISKIDESKVNRVFSLIHSKNDLIFFLTFAGASSKIIHEAVTNFPKKGEFKVSVKGNKLSIGPQWGKVDITRLAYDPTKSFDANYANIMKAFKVRQYSFSDLFLSRAFAGETNSGPLYAETVIDFGRYSLFGSVVIMAFMVSSGGSLALAAGIAALATVVGAQVGKVWVDSKWEESKTAIEQIMALKPHVRCDSTMVTIEPLTPDKNSFMRMIKNPENNTYTFSLVLNGNDVQKTGVPPETKILLDGLATCSTEKQAEDLMEKFEKANTEMMNNIPHQPPPAPKESGTR